MKTPPLFTLGLLLALAPSGRVLGAARDDASQSTYAGGWNEAGGGSGFGDWKFQDHHGESESFSGHFIADLGANGEIRPIATAEKAFGLFANGSEFEFSAAFRALAAPLKKGETFAFQMLNGIIEQKGATDDAGAGAVGLTLRSGNSADSPEDYNKGARFEISNLKGEANYQVYDGESAHDTGVAYCEQGVAVTVALTGVDAYDLAITRLDDRKTTRLPGRKLGGSGPIESFCLFNRNGEKADGFFNKLEIRAAGK